MAINMYIDGKENIFAKHTHFNVGETEEGAVFSGKSSDRFCRYKGGVPLAYDAERNRVAVDSSDAHTLVFGATGSRKTRCVIEPTIKILGYAKESMIINDPKSEIYNRLAGELREKGYNIIVLNIREPRLGNSWNPLAIPYRFYIEGNLDKAAEFANDVAANLAVKSNSNEPFWDNSAVYCLFGLIMLLMKYAKEHGKDESFVNISSLIELRTQFFSSGNSVKFSALWQYAKKEEIIANALSNTVYAPEATRNSILSVLDEKFHAFSIMPSLLDMLANNDIDIGSIDKQKTAVFLIIPDEKDSYNSLISLFVKQAYEYLIYTATKNDTLALCNRVNFILDEFCSLPPISSMATMISAARSRSIRFVFAVQSYHSLKMHYKEIAETIKSNCLNWIYLTSREIELLREISALCGEQRSRMPNISVYDLQHFDKEKGEVLILNDRMKPAITNLLDIDSFGESEYTVLDFEVLPRFVRERSEFKLDKRILGTLIEENKIPAGEDSPFKKALDEFEKNKNTSGQSEGVKD